MGTTDGEVERLVNSRKRVADHGEVFTPALLVTDMLDLVKSETERIYSRFLEPACGSGNFLIPILERKLAVVPARYGSGDFERRHYAVLALMCVCGIELLPDNAEECRPRLLGTFGKYLKSKEGDLWWRAALRVLALNIVEGGALSMTTPDQEPIMFPEWGYLGQGKDQRRDFCYDALTQRSSILGTIGAPSGKHEAFVPVATHPRMTVQELAA